MFCNKIFEKKKRSKQKEKKKRLSEKQVVFVFLCLHVGNRTKDKKSFFFRVWLLPKCAKKQMACQSKKDFPVCFCFL